MLPSLIAFLAIMLGTVLVMRAYREWRAQPAAMRAGRTAWLATGAGLLVALLLAGLASGRLLLFLLPAALVLALFLPRRTGTGSPPPARPAEVIETPFLRAFKANGLMPMDATVTAGSFSGSRLSELPLSDLIWLHQQIDDPASVDLLERFLGREFPGWRDRAGGAAEVVSADMTASRAREILGLEPNATTREIVTAHRRLIQRLHPDRGGTGYLATLLNRAKDVLLENEKR